MRSNISRRRSVLGATKGTAALMAVHSLGCSSRSKAPAIVYGDRPQLPFGVASGDVTADSVILWSRCDRPARMSGEWSIHESFKDATPIGSAEALPSQDFTARLDVGGLPANSRIFYRIQFADLARPTISSEPVSGTFHTAPLAERDVRFAWSGDVAGQGWGINAEWGGMRIFETIRQKAPEFFIHSGDSIYADQPILPQVTLPDGKIWKNITTPAKSKPAETLDDFRGAYQYNLMDENVRRFNASIPMIVQWDDHEVMNNWFPGEVIDDPKYTEKNLNVLSARENHR